MSAAADVLHVRAVSDRIIHAIGEEGPEVAIVALLDAGARILGVSAGLSAPRALGEIVRVAKAIGLAEAGQ